MSAQRPSLLWPGRPAAPLVRRDWGALALTYLLAVAVRWPIRLAHPYTAEASHFAVAQSLWRNPGNIRSLHEHLPPDDFSWFFWERPLLSLLMWPSASLGWEAYRTTHLLVGALVPVLAVVLLRRLDVRAPYAYATGIVLSVHPGLVPWSVLVLPDTLVCAFTLAALLTAHGGRVGATFLLLLAASWVKEVGFVTPLALGLMAWWRDADGVHGRLWPVELGRFATALLPLVPLAFLPLAVSLQFPGAVMPGFRVGGELAPMVERLFLLVWLLPVAVIGVARAQARRLSVVALAWPAFFLAYHAVTGKAIEAWYNVVPATLVLMASAATLSSFHPPRPEAPAGPSGAPPYESSHLERREPSAAAPATPPSSRARPGRIAAAVALLLAAALAVQVAVPQAEPVNRAVATPWSGTGQWNLEEAIAYEAVREDDLYEALAAVPAGLDEAWLAVDVDWSLVMYPLGERAALVYKEYTGVAPKTDDDLRWMAQAVGARVQVVLLYRTASPLNGALQDAYQGCSQPFGNYVLALPAACPDAEERLVESYRARTA